MVDKTPLLVVAGPTASGKSDVAVELALRLDGEIVSADSMQIYKYMDIGTAKVDIETRAKVPHHMLDIVEPHEDFNLANYQEQATSVCLDIWKRGKLPIMAGGTGLYIRAVTENFPLEDMPHSQEVRDKLNHEWEALGQEAMYQRLMEVDSQSALRFAPVDQRRIVRALEVYQLTGKPASEIQRVARENSPFRPLITALYLERPELYRKIEKRAEIMINQGLIGEYISLIDMGYSPDCNAMMGLGYRHSRNYVEGVWTLEETLEHLKRDTRRYAKRQLTWFRGMEDVNWQDNTNPNEVITSICDLAAGKFDLAAK